MLGLDHETTYELVDDSTPASTQAFIESEIAKWRDVVKLAGATVD